jgi:pilus assembly protein CpaF
MNTGHYGSLTTVHANSPADALRRLESLVLMGGFELPSRAIRDLLGAALDLIVHVMRQSDGSRRVTSIGEVVLAGEQLLPRELFRFDGGRPGCHLATGQRPSFLARLAHRGHDLDALFATGGARSAEPLPPAKPSTEPTS